MMRLLAVGMRDVAVFGCDTFWVEALPDRVELFEANTRGDVRHVPCAPISVEALEFELVKRQAAFLLREPVLIEALADLRLYVGTFELGRDGYCIPLASRPGARG